jgi:hypothetical protein
MDIDGTPGVAFEAGARGLKQRRSSAPSVWSKTRPLFAPEQNRCPHAVDMVVCTIKYSENAPLRFACTSPHVHEPGEEWLWSDHG